MSFFLHYIRSVPPAKTPAALYTAGLMVMRKTHIRILP
jgi:hypothetical protein